VCYPNTYAAGMSNLGFQSLFHRTASFHGLRAARFFLESGGARGNAPTGALYSPEAYDPRKTELFPSRRPTLRGFDVLLFSISFELDYAGALAMLKLSDIALRADERARDDRFREKPFLLMGGITVSANPAIMSAFADALFIGDMEEGLEEILRVLAEREFRKSEAVFEELRTFPGVFISGGAGGAACRTASRGRPGGRAGAVVRAVAKTLGEPAHTAVLTKDTEFSDMFLVEVVRGCRNACRFCMTRCVGGPVRSARREAVLETVSHALPFTKRVGLIGPVLTDNRELPRIVEGINGLGAVVSFSSLRADDFDERIASLLEKNGQSSLTFAPETGSPRLRELIGKGMEGERLLEAVSTALRHGVRHFRYYLMYGLPGETEEDVRLTAELVVETLGLLEARPGTSLHLSVNPFVPKKGTPFESERIHPPAYYREAGGRLSGLLAETGAPPKTLSIKFESLRLLPLHVLLSLGGAEAVTALGEAVERSTPKILEQAALEFAYGPERGGR
jgi:radical SAM superfamily enzyme YgiQ (UPF0313 family)